MASHRRSRGTFWGVTSRGSLAALVITLTVLMVAALVGIVVLANELRQTAKHDDTATVHLAQLNEVSQTV